MTRTFYDFYENDYKPFFNKSIPKDNLHSHNIYVQISLLNNYYYNIVWEMNSKTSKAVVKCK